MHYFHGFSEIRIDFSAAGPRASAPSPLLPPPAGPPCTPGRCRARRRGGRHGPCHGGRRGGRHGGRRGGRRGPYHGGRHGPYHGGCRGGRRGPRHGQHRVDLTADFTAATHGRNARAVGSQRSASPFSPFPPCPPSPPPTPSAPSPFGPRLAPGHGVGEPAHAHEGPRPRQLHLRSMAASAAAGKVAHVQSVCRGVGGWGAGRSTAAGKLCA